MKSKTCKGCKWLEFAITSKNHNGVDVDVYYCIEPERLANMGYYGMDHRYLYRCKKFSNLKILRKEKLYEINKQDT